MSEKAHEILRRDEMPNGTHIQIENWKEVYPDSHKTLTIGAYPIAKNDGYWIRRNEGFRLTIDTNFGSDDEVISIYNSLIQGKTSLEELSEHYSDPHKAKYYMGIEDEEDRRILAQGSADGCRYFNLPKSSYRSYGLEPKDAEEIWISSGNGVAAEVKELIDHGVDPERALMFCNVD